MQSSSSLFEQYIGLWPNRIIQGRFFLSSGELAFSIYSVNIFISQGRGVYSYQGRGVYSLKAGVYIVYNAGVYVVYKAGCI